MGRSLPSFGAPVPSAEIAEGTGAIVGVFVWTALVAPAMFAAPPTGSAAAPAFAGPFAPAEAFEEAICAFRLAAGALDVGRETAASRKTRLKRPATALRKGREG